MAKKPSKKNSAAAHMSPEEQERLAQAKQNLQAKRQQQQKAKTTRNITIAVVVIAALVAIGLIGGVLWSKKSSSREPAPPTASLSKRTKASSFQRTGLANASKACPMWIFIPIMSACTVWSLNRPLAMILYRPPKMARST